MNTEPNGGSGSTRSRPACACSSSRANLPGRRRGGLRLTAADESNLTGEAVPAEKQGRRHRSRRTLNLWDRSKPWSFGPPGSRAQKIIRLIHESQRLKALPEVHGRFGTDYTLAILSLTVVGVFVSGSGSTARPSR
jgi:hypothetical protein